LKYGIKKLLAGVLLGIFAFAGTAFAEPDYTLIHHDTSTFLKEWKSVYDDAMFQHISFSLEYDRPATVADESAVGPFTIKNGTYAYWDENNQRQNVAGENRTFALRYLSGDPTYVEFGPRHTNGNESEILFRRSADGGLQGKAFNWDLDGDSGSGTVPNFRTTKEQHETYAPYVELTDTSVIWKMVSPVTGEAINVPFQSRYRIALLDSNGSQLERSDLQPFNADIAPSGVFNFSVQRQDIKRVRIDAYMDAQEVPANSAYSYRWNFFVATESDAGITSGLTPLNLNAGEERTLSFTFEGGYR